MRLLEGTPWDRPPHCERCEQLESECKCPPLPVADTYRPPQAQTARLAVEKRKKGKMVTVIRGLTATETDLPALLSQLKSAIGAGGTLADGEIEVQGEQLERVRQFLIKTGYKVKG